MSPTEPPSPFSICHHAWVNILVGRVEEITGAIMARKIAGLLILAAVFLWAWGSPARCQSPVEKNEAQALTKKAIKLYRAGRYQEALPLAQRALKIWQKSLGPEHPKTIIPLNNLAGLHKKMGAYDRALPLYQRVLKIREKSLGPEHLNTVNSLNKLALLYEKMGSLDKALPLAQRALKIIENKSGPQHPYTATSLNNLAELYYRMGAYDKGLRFYQRALKIREKVLGREHPDTAISLDNLASLYQAMGAYDQALPLYRQALKITEKALGPEHRDTRVALGNVGTLYLARNDYQAAEAYFRRAKSTAGLAEIALAQGQPKEALKLLQSMALTWRSSPLFLVEYHTQYGLALAGVGHMEKAALALRQAVQGVEDLRSRTPGEKASFFQAGSAGGYIRAYRGLVSVLAEIGLKKEKLPHDLGEHGPGAGNAAFYFAEATKGRVLLESLAAAARKTSRVELPEELRRREESLLNQMTALKDQWEKALQGGEIAVKEAREKKARLTSEQRALVKELQQKFPVYAALHYPEPLAARELPLKPQEVLLEYALGDQASYILVVRQGGVNKIIRIPLGRKALEEKVKSFMAPLLDVKLSAFSVELGKELGDLLLKEALAQVREGERLIIVPDGLLGLVPFEALVLQPGQGLADTTYVGDKYSLSYYQSAAVLALQRRLRAAEPSRQFFALGNPVFSKHDRRYVLFKHRGAAPQTPVQAPEKYAFRALATHRDWGKTRQGDRGRKELTFPPLPETETEVQTIARTLGVKESPPDVLLNIQANETYLRKSPLGDYRYLHFATHADLPGTVQGIKEPFILLGQVENKKGDDGFLTLSEVLGLKLKADLVVLSACNTGRGRMMAGEGVVNFARAFQHAGAQSVLVSLWPLASKEAVAYMTAFYSHLKAGKSRAAALRQARQEIKTKYPHPFFWAVFILHGEG